MTENSNRQLAAILAADVANYSGLVRADEDGVIRTLRDMRSSVIAPLIASHSGRIANTAGDSLLVEFSSAVDAVRCGLAFQDAVARYIKDHPDKPALWFRIGVNIGDVIASGDDLLGDGVNIAARIEALAEPGEVLVSRTVADFLRTVEAFTVTPLGARKVKNIPERIEVFRVTRGEASPADRVRFGRWRIVAAAVLCVALAAGWFLWDRSRSVVEAASQERMAFPLPDKPSIAVLPLNALSDGDAMLANGLTDDLITDLSKFSGLFVIAGNTSFAYGQADMGIAQFAEALGVRYVVDGSLRRTENALRVNARLTDATTGRVAWAERYEGPVEDVFDVQSDLVVAIVSALDLPVEQAEMEQVAEPDTRELEAREAFQRGWELYGRFNEGDNAAAIPHFERAVELDPDYGRAHGALALAHLRPHLFHHWNAFQDTSGGLHIAGFFKAYKEALKHDTALVHVIGAMVRLNLRDAILPLDDDFRSGSAQLQAARAIALSPSDPEGHVAMAWALIADGQPAEGLTFVEAAMRLDPAYPSHYILFQAAGRFALGELETARDILLAGLERDPHAVELLPVTASILAQLGQRREARQLLDRWQSGQNPAALQAAVEDYFFIVRWTGPDQILNHKIKNGLRLAALPENVTVSSLRSDLSSADPARRLDAVRSLALFGPAAAEAVAELVPLLAAESSILRRSTAITLGRIGPAAHAAIPALEGIGPETLVGRHARRALEQIRTEPE